MNQHFRRFACCLLLCALLFGIVPTPANAAFADVPSGHWAEREIAHCAELGVFGGVSADRFGLGQSMTRSAFAVVLCRFFGWDTTSVRQIFPGCCTFVFVQVSLSLGVYRHLLCEEFISV